MVEKIEAVLESITAELFPEYKEDEGEVYQQAPIQFEFWIFLRKNYNQWVNDKNLVAHFEELANRYKENLQFSSFIRRENEKESKIDFRERVYRNLSVNQRSKINEKLLKRKTSALTPSRMICYAYIGCRRKEMGLLVDPTAIKEALERDIKQTQSNKKKELYIRALEELRPTIEGKEETERQKEGQENEEKGTIESREHILPSEFDKSDYLRPLVEWIEDQRREKHYVARTLKEISSEPLQRGCWNVEDIVTSKDDLVIVGEPGSGKTSLLHTLVLELIQNEKDLTVPLYIRLDRYKPESKESLLERIKGEIRKVLRQDLSEEDLSKKDLLFLFDHIDQAISKDVTDAINDISSDILLSRHRFIVACRSNVYYHDLLHFRVLKIEDFTDDDIRKILENSGISKLYDKLKNDRTLITFCRKPLHLNMLIKMYKNRWDVLDFDNRTNLYDEFVKAVFREERKRTERKTRTVGFSDSLKFEALAALAYDMYESNITFIDCGETREKMYKKILKVLEKHKRTLDDNSIKEIILQIEEEGSLVTFNRENFSFVHLTLLDFFCAWYMVNCLSEEQALSIISSKVDPLEFRWEPSIQFYAGLVNDATSLIEIIMKCAEKEKIETIKYKGKNGIPQQYVFYLLFAGRCVAEARYTGNKVLCERIIDEILEKYFDGSYIESCLTILVRVRNNNIVNRLVSRLDDQNHHLRRRAVIALGEIGSNISFGPLGKRMNLREIFDYKVLKVLIERLDDEESMVRFKAAIALIQIGTDETVKLLINGLGDQRKWVRFWAIYALGKIGTNEVVSLLISRLEDQIWEIQLMAASALIWIGPSEDRRWIGRVVETLIKIGPTKSSKMMVELLRCEEHFNSVEVFVEYPFLDRLRQRYFQDMFQDILISGKLDLVSTYIRNWLQSMENTHSITKDDAKCIMEDKPRIKIEQFIGQFIEKYGEQISKGIQFYFKSET